MRILIAPLPKPWGGPGVFLSRVAEELSQLGYNWTSLPFHYSGFSPMPWNHAFMMGCPRFSEKILNSGKPVITTMGKPEICAELQAVGRKYDKTMEKQEARMASVIMRSNKIVFISEYVHQIWRRIFSYRGLAFPDQQNVSVIHHGLDISHFRIGNRRSNPTEETFVIGTVGAIREEFRLLTLFETSQLLPFKHTLLIVGSMTPECDKIYKEFMENPILRERTEYVEWVTAEKLPNLYQRMHCLFHPVDYEGCGIVCAEALSCGVPVVVPGHGAPQEYVLPDGGLAVETTQYIYDVDFCSKMAEAIVMIRKDWERFSIGAIRMAYQKLSIKKTVEKYLMLMGLI